MPAVMMINQGDKFRLEEDWSPLLTWDKRNLVLLRKLKFTGQQKISVGRAPKIKDGAYERDANGRYIYEEQFRNETVPNPLFRGDDGAYTPVIVNFPKDLEFVVSKLNTSYDGFILSVWLKVVNTPDNRFTDRCVSVKINQLNGANIEILSSEEDDEI